MDLSLKISLNTLASSAGRVIGSFLGLVSIGLITRALGREGFGEYSTVLAFLATFQILADLGLYTLLTREISQKPEQEKALVSSFFTLRLISAVFFLLLAAGLINLFPYPHEVKVGALIASGGFLFMSLTQILMGVFQKYLQTYKSAVAEVVGRGVQLGFVWYFFQAGGGLYYFLGAMALASGAIFLLNFFFAWRLVRFYIVFSPAEWKKILKTTLPIAVSLLFTLLYFKADTILLSVLTTQEDVGIYNAAYKILETLIFFPAVVVGLLFPILSRYATENRERFSLLLTKTTHLMGLGAFPLVVGGIILSSSLVNLIGGREFLISTAPLQVLFLAVGIIFFGTLYGNSVIALSLQKKAMWVYIAGFIFNFAANLIVIPHYSYMGAAWTTVVTELFVTAFLVFIIWRATPFRVSVGTITKTALAALVMGAVVFWFVHPITNPLSPVMFLLVVFLGAGLYLSAIYTGFGKTALRNLVQLRG